MPPRPTVSRAIALDLARRSGNQALCRVVAPASRAVAPGGTAEAVVVADGLADRLAEAVARRAGPEATPGREAS